MFPGGEKPDKEFVEAAEAIPELTHKHLEEMLQFLISLRNSDPRSYNEANITERQKGLKGREDAVLLNSIAKSSRLRWKEKPSYYHALVREIQDRGIFKTQRE